MAGVVRCRVAGTGQWMAALLLLLAAQPGVAGESTSQAAATVRDPRLAAMQRDPRGPFARIRWFCLDGTLLPPEPDACKPHGGGAQHGEWSDTTKALRAAGYAIANIYADLDIEALLATPDAHDTLAQMLVERYLLRADDGWILRRARSYRGAFQEEGERKGAARLLRALAARAEWTGPRFLALRSLAAALPHGADTPSARGVRQLSAALAVKEPDFFPLRNKIHAAPSADDGAAVRAYAVGVEDAALAAEFAALARDIDALYAVSTVDLLAGLAGVDTALDEAIAAHRASRADEAGERYLSSAHLLAALREALPVTSDANRRVGLLDASAQVEAEHFRAATELVATLPGTSRAQHLELVAAAIDAAYGTGVLSARQRAALGTDLAALGSAPTLPAWRALVARLALVPVWAERHLAFQFGTGMAKLGELEPLARLYAQDHLRGSPLFFQAALLERLQGDANRLAGVAHRLFERKVPGGLRALNPGLARGVLRDGRTLDPADFTADGIYLLPETVADLPPVAGILTAGEGNPLSHVQLLARNLGIPNVAIDDDLLDSLAAHGGEHVVLAVSGGGTVHLLPDDGSLDTVFAREGADQRPVIEPELDKLLLERRDFIDLAELRATDSGRIVGPKAAKLGELKHHYPEAVADGIALPFGTFRALLDAPAPDGSASMMAFIVANYRRLEALPAGSTERAVATETFRAGLHDWVAQARLPADFATRLAAALGARFGADGSYGVFVRSDTNVEDLPGFTGAGLNLTLPNVVGFEAIAAAIPRVWASPFTARAFAWRQALMREPEHVYPAVLLLGSVDADKSGVLVTQDVDTADRGWLSVAVNEGVGGAVDGQAAESLRIELATGRVRLMAQASAPVRRQIDPAGGIRQLPASGADAVLGEAEVAALVRFATELPQRFPPIVDAAGQPAPADVEFGFEDGALRLFQIRPFLDNPATRRNGYLKTLDADAGAQATITVPLAEVLP